MTENLDTATARRPHVIEAATALFLKYGYERTTMGDIAKASGVSRPTLYASFSDKEQIYRAVLGAMASAKLAEIEEGLSRYDDLGSRVYYACEAWTLEGFDLIRGNPDARDLFDVAIPAVRETYAAFEAFLAELLRDAAERASYPASPEELARVVSSSLKGLKDLAGDGAELRRMIRGLTAAITTALTAPAS